MSLIFKRESGSIKSSTDFIRQTTSRPSLYERFALDSVLTKHTGSVNEAAFNRTGELLVSGSDDGYVNLWNVNERELRLSWQTTHTANIFSVIFIPETNDGVVVSGAGDGMVQMHDITHETTQVLTQHYDRVKVVQVYPDMPQVVLSGSEDQTIRELDMRMSSYRKMLKLRNPIHTFDICQTKPWLLAVGGTNDILKVFDRRNLCTEVENPKSVWSMSLTDLDPKGETEGITGVKFSSDGSQVLANFFGNCIYLLSLIDETNEKMELPTQKRKRKNFPSTSSTSEDDRWDEEVLMDFVIAAVQQLSRDNYDNTKNIANKLLALYGDFWKMHYVLVKCHIFEGSLENALRAVTRGIEQTHHLVLIRLETEIERLIKSSTPSRDDASAVNCVQLAEMVSVLGLDYHILFPDGISEEDYGTLTHLIDMEMELAVDRIPEDAETLLQLMGSPVSGLIDQDDDNSSFYDWGWTEKINSDSQNQRLDNYTAMMNGIGKTIAAGETYSRSSANWEMRYQGHIHIKTIKSVSFLTPEESLVCAGSDDGRLFVWEKDTGRVVASLKGDKYAVNGAISHPYDPMIASWGVDDTVKIWTPSLPRGAIKGTSFYTRLARNQILLENEALFF